MNTTSTPAGCWARQSFLGLNTTEQPYSVNIFLRFMFLRRNMLKKRFKMKYRREWEALPFCNSEPTLSSTIGHTFTTWFDFSSVSREFSKDLKSHFRTLAADAFKRGKTHASTSLFTNYFPCLDWSRKWCDVLFNQSGTNPKITTDIWLGSR